MSKRSEPPGLSGWNKRATRFIRVGLALLQYSDPPRPGSFPPSESLRMLFRSPLPTLTLLVLASSSFAEDWPQFRGPKRDGLSTETGLLKSWPTEGPPLTWTAKGLGGGFSSVSIVGDRIYTLGNKNKLTHVVALERNTGKVLWSAEVGPEGGSLGCTPTVEGNRVFALGQEGDLVCIDATGKRVWHRNVIEDFGGVYGGWKYCESPLVDGEKLIVTPGGKDATMVALNKTTGEE